MSLPGFSVRNPVTVNILMWGIMVAGMYQWMTLTREFFPESSADRLLVSVRWPGASPTDVEKGLALPLERELEGLEDVDEITSKSLEGMCVLDLKLEEGADSREALGDLRAEMDAFSSTLPEGAEDPDLREVKPWMPVISVALYGDVDEMTLRHEARRFRDRLLTDPQVSRMVAVGLRDRECLVEADPFKLESHGLTFEELGRALAADNLDLTGGALKGPSATVSVRARGETPRRDILLDLPVRTQADGRVTRLRDVATLREGFEDTPERGWFAGKSAATLTVFKTADQDALKIAASVKRAVAEHDRSRVKVECFNDLSRFIEQRLDLMLRNALGGFILVALCLAFFLDLQTAFWVAMGLPTSFLGSFIIMRLMGDSINLISLFGMIIVLGMLVDDAIVVGENVYEKMRKGIAPLKAAAEGATEVALPVAASVLTTIVAFFPLLQIKGIMGSMMGVVPRVVIAALCVSLLEAFLILPCHLAHRWGWLDRQSRRGILGRFAAFKERLSGEIMPRWLERLNRPLLRWRYVTIAAGFSLTLGLVGLVAGGVVPFEFMQKVDSEIVYARIKTRLGTPEAETESLLRKLEALCMEQPEVKTAFTCQGMSFGDRGVETSEDPSGTGQIMMELHDAGVRRARGQRTAEQLSTMLRREASLIPNLKEADFSAQAGMQQGADIEIHVRHDDPLALTAAVGWVREALGKNPSVMALHDNLFVARREISLHMREDARSLGLSQREMALQVRHALFGYEAQRVQEEDDEVTVRVMLPRELRQGPADLEALRLSLPGGGRAPLGEVADFEPSTGTALIERREGHRMAVVSAAFDPGADPMYPTSDSFITAFEKTLPALAHEIPGASASFEGRRRELRNSMSSLGTAVPAALLLIYMVIAMLFRSYIQPLIIMVAIPYSVIGAILGHWIMGYPITFLSLIGLVALSGIVVNDSIVLVDHINRLRRENPERSLFETVVTASRDRLRAIQLTSITTMAGLAPLMLETSFQAQFLIPMAISLVFGLGFATILTLVIIPALYLVSDDLRGAVTVGRA